jgi:xylan 1,4-beta-xylosidase
LKVGGPATSINAWIPDMIQFCKGNQVPLDFISTHHYPTDDPLWKKGSTDRSVLMELFQSGQLGKYERGIVKKMTSKAREEAGKYPLYYTEWNTSALTNEDQHDESYAAAMAAKILADNDGLVDGYAFWTFSDIFEESGQLAGVFHGGFGLMNYYGIPKPIYRYLDSESLLIIIKSRMRLSRKK